MRRTLLATVRRGRGVSWIIGTAVLLGSGCTAPGEEPEPSTGSAVIEVMDFESGEVEGGPNPKGDGTAEGSE